MVLFVKITKYEVVRYYFSMTASAKATEPQTLLLQCTRTFKPILVINISTGKEWRLVHSIEMLEG